MEIMTITDEAKKAIADLCNKAVLIEYDMILNYPRAINHIVNYEEIRDEQLINDLNTLGNDSLGHFNKIGNLVSELGHKSIWEIGACDKISDVLECLTHQVEKEKMAVKTYQDARRIALNNKTKVKGRDFFGKLIRVRDSVAEDVITADEVISILDRIILDEERHVRIAEDSVATYQHLLSDKNKTKL